MLETQTHPEVALAQQRGIRPVVHLVACGFAKLDTEAPARDLYTGDVTRKAIAFASTRGGYCVILSARYGVLDLDEVVAPYDTRLDDLTPGELDDWRAMLVEQLADRGILNATIFVHGGQRYTTELAKALADTTARVVPYFDPADLRTPRNAMIGNRKRHYNLQAIHDAASLLPAAHDDWEQFA